MILDTIVARKRAEVDLLKREGIRVPAHGADPVDPPRGFRNALLHYQGVAVIAEAKKASPSKGVIRSDFDIVEIVRTYEENGAQALSVLTDVDFFQGSLDYLLAARKNSTLPVLRKDFIIDELQIHQAAAYGADAILLIAAILETAQIRDYQALASELHMDVLVEVHDEDEVEKVLETPCNLIGVNNRNLRDFSVDLDTTFRLQKLIPKTVPMVSESGLKDASDLARLAAAGIEAALIGETLMRAGTDGNVLQGLRRNAAGA